MDLSIIIHTPNLSEDREKLQQVINEKEWHSQLRNLTFVMENELSVSAILRANLQTPPVNQFLVQFSARLCYLV